MTKKILFLLTFLLTTLGGGNSAWAEDITYNFSAYLSGTAGTANTQNCSLTSYSGSNQQTIPAGTACSTYYWSKINGDDYYYVINGYKDFAAGDVLTVYLYGNGTTVGCLVGSAKKKLELTTATKSEINTIEYTLVAGDIESDGTLRIYRDGGSTYFAGVSIASTRTIASDNTIQTYPYTWDFSNRTNDQWVQTFKDMGLYTTSSPAQWTHITSEEPAANYRPAVTRSDWQYDVALLKGLKFNKATTGSSPCLDYQYQHLWVEEGTIITIPSVKAGQKIQLTGNVNISGNSSNLTQVTANPEYTVTSDGDVTLTFNDSWIKTISVQKKEQTLAFDKESYTVDFGATGVLYTAKLSPVTGANVTYSSSDNTVATVDESTGVITTVNSGTCEITATAAETAEYAEATASYTLMVTGSKTPTLKWIATDNGNTYTVADLPYGNSKYYKAAINTTDGSDVTASDIRYGVVEEYEGYLTVGATDGKIQPTRKFADDGVDFKVVQVYAYTPSSGDRNASPRILYNVRIVKGTFSDDLFKENELNVNVNHTIAPKNNLQSMRWEDIDAITVTLLTGESSTAVPGTGESTVTDYKTATPKATYFDTKTPTSGDNAGHEVVDWFYPIFKGLAVGTVTYRVTMSSSLYGDLSGDITLHVKEVGTSTGFAWAAGTQSEYTIYEGDYMLLPEITGNTNGNFSYSSGYDNQNTHHKYVYTRRWDGSKYVTTYNNKNFHKGEGFPNFELTEDALGNTPVPEVQADGSGVALLFWNTGTGTEHDQLLIYGNQAGTVYLKAFDPQITTRALPTIKIVVKSKTDINTDFVNLKNSMTFPYTWDFTTDYDWSTEIETGTGNWKLNGSSYDLGMSSNINYDYADEDKNEKVWGNDNNDPTTDSNELTDKLLVGKEDKVLRGFAGMKIRLGNNGTGSWYSKRDGIHILPYSDSDPGAPRLRVTTGTHTLILPKPTGENCPATFKVFVKVKALETGDGTLWVRNADLDRNASGQNKYHDFKSASEGDVIIYSVNASKGQSLELDLDKVDIYWIAYSTEAKNLAKPSETTTYYASTYSYPKGLDIIKSEEANPKITAYYAGYFNSSDAVTMYQIDNSQGEVPSNTGMLLKATTDPATNPGSLYMIAAAENINGEKSISGLYTNYLKANLTAGSVMPTTDENTNFVLTYRYKRVHVDGTVDPEHTNGDWSFYRPVPTGATIGANAAYLQVPGDLYVMSAASRRAGSDDDNRPAAKQLINIIFDDDPSGNTGTTEINDISNNVGIGSDAWYTLQGVRVEAPTKGGIYIHNGRKVVIK